jgi:hypothetical protein
LLFLDANPEFLGDPSAVQIRAGLDAMDRQPQDVVVELVNGVGVVQMGTREVDATSVLEIDHAATLATVVTLDLVNFGIFKRHPVLLVDLALDLHIDLPWCELPIGISVIRLGHCPAN